MRRIVGPRSVVLPKGEHIATPGELREPVVYVRSARTPDATTGYDQTFTKYGQGFAKVRFSQRRVQAGENADAKYSHVFVIRYPGYEIEESTFIVWGKALFQVVSSQRTGVHLDFLTIRAQENMQTNGKPFTIVDGDSTSPVSVAESSAEGETDLGRANNDFWNT